MKRSDQILPLLTTILCFLLCPGQFLFSQCTNGTQPECKCTTAPVLCTIDELDGYTFSMTSFQHPNDGPSPICPGANISQTNNPTWFAFTAWCTDLNLRVSSSNCQQVQGYIGFQLAIYTDCTFDQLVACNAAIGDCNTNDKILNLTGLNIGSIYYFMVDGCLGSYCTVTIDILGVCGQEHIDPWSEPISGNLDPCIGDTETYTVEDLGGARIYHWFLNGALLQETASNEITIPWTSSGPYELCIDASNEPCVSISDPPTPLCTIITVHEANAGLLNISPAILCPGDSAHFVSSGFTASEDNTQMLLITGANGQIIEIIQAATGTFTSLATGMFTVYAYNIVPQSGVVPVVGQQISSIDCSSPCCDLISQEIVYQQMQAVVSDIMCDNNGTDNDASDDWFTFNVLVTGLTPGMAWRSSDGTIGGLYGTPKLCGPYLINGGVLNLDLHDFDIPTCWTSITVIPPMACSECLQTMDVGASSFLTCNVEEVTLTGQTSAMGIYHWMGPNSFLSDSLICKVTAPGWYFLSVDFGNSCVHVDSVFVDQDIETPVAHAGADQQLDCNHTEVLLDASGSSGNNLALQWINLLGDVISTQSMMLVDSAGTYLLQLLNSVNGCTAYDTAQVTINENDLGEITIEVSDEICFGDQNGVIDVVNISGGMPPFIYLLNGITNSSSGLFDHLSPGEYILHVSDAEGCAMDTWITIMSGVGLEVDLPATILVTEDQNEVISANVNVPETDLMAVQWMPPGVVLCDTCLSTFIHTSNQQTLSVTVTHMNGCIATDEINIVVVPAPEIFIPNIFSPNDDGLNDHFTLFSNDGVVDIIELNVFDRWGEHLFHAEDIDSNNPEEGWDGKFHHKEMPPGVYVYTISIKLADGMEKTLTGDITLVR